MYEIGFDKDWFKYWKKIPQNLHFQLLNKMKELKEEKTFRHLKHGLPYFVLESGQYRVCFKEKDNLRTLYFVGDHKEYEKWYSSILE